MKRGFTLIELIIVIIIIGLLASVGMNQYGKAIANAKNAQAKGVLSQMRKAALAYQSKEGTWPAAAAGVAINVDLDADGTNDVSFTPPTSSDFVFTSAAAGTGTGQAAKTASAGAGVNNWRIDYTSGVISTY
jgi:prepilin-type N-terminal cleavage/methylation domain-containing protein